MEALDTLGILVCIELICPTFQCQLLVASLFIRTRLESSGPKLSGLLAIDLHLKNGVLCGIQMALCICSADIEAMLLILKYGIRKFLPSIQRLRCGHSLVEEVLEMKQ